MDWNRSIFSGLATKLRIYRMHTFVCMCQCKQNYIECCVVLLKLHRVQYFSSFFLLKGDTWNSHSKFQGDQTSLFIKNQESGVSVVWWLKYLTVASKWTSSSSSRPITFIYKLHYPSQQWVKYYHCFSSTCMNLTLHNLQRLICFKTKKSNQTVNLGRSYDLPLWTTLKLVKLIFQHSS